MCGQHRLHAAVVFNATPWLHFAGDDDEEDTLDAFMRGNAPPPLRRQPAEEEQEEPEERQAQQQGELMQRLRKEEVRVTRQLLS